MSRRYAVLLEWDSEGPGYAVTVPGADAQLEVVVP